MTAQDADQDPQDRIGELLASAAEAELQLLRNERKAERRLAEALEILASDTARLLKTQERMERSREAVVAAQARLGEVQANRAAGPTRVQDCATTPSRAINRSVAFQNRSIRAACSPDAIGRG